MSEDRFLLRTEYRVRPVTRFIITKFEQWSDDAGSSQSLGEHVNAHIAWEVAYALCKQRHELLGWPMADERIKYPSLPEVVDEAVSS